MNVASRTTQFYKLIILYDFYTNNVTTQAAFVFSRDISAGAIHRPGLWKSITFRGKKFK